MTFLTSEWNSSMCRVILHKLFLNNGPLETDFLARKFEKPAVKIKLETYNIKV